MSTLSYVDKERMANYFGFKSGYVFTFLKNGYNKTNTRNIILEACGIDIFHDEEYDMSQERCIRKIWDEKDDYTNGQLLKVMLDYYMTVANWSWDWKDEQDYNYLRDLEKTLCSGRNIGLPPVDKYDMKLLQRDIDHNIAANTPELVLDRLHTFSTQYIRDVSNKHGISIKNDKGENFSIDTMVVNLKNYYKDSDYFSSEFCIVAIQNSINIFAKFNVIRNNHSFSHPNPILDKIEAEYAVRIVADTLAFIDKIENAKVTNIIADEDDELPF